MNRRTPLVGALALTTGLALTGCSSDAAPALEVTGAFMPQPVSDMAAGFLVVKNSGGSDRLTSVTSSLSDHVTIHETTNQAMRMVTSFEVPAGGELDLERGGGHIMFADLKKRPRQGDTVSVQLHFEKAGPISVDVPVKETTYNPKKK
ncbi:MULTISPECIES: copper chaperone PCu(A)C [unclassified Streptomyces]|uniref:copper chaperone PCu(A)C n=1 Tax=Streptomyces TaxID=1883 RepID=UPI0001C1B0D9|nr:MULTISPECIES: copper chaperone PCu(A)C [unclassified Streptomyces]MYR65727.1 copper chaperone PCu(A)C [Streptomyces sp. SID4939]MYR99846.1 copper chaperone PCu(A)C [Streptomyces sp. SID4940]MYT63489.1 copper chaperone PCu(A)C [Streptomyces sp. SID8357]MYT85739.1 copper chaperone PCu(A)C [Streptomyces sp. SID8360]MYU32925.1 copper chaperone PCu(A)C [Streptomyces sp. SID8358]MYW38710.1 copper chaperone PCu(A)C [Streptomyces sp. SID1]MYX72493.1 copper chaperone PCu(A)C [Streptomyces sp. SID3